MDKVNRLLSFLIIFAGLAFSLCARAYTERDLLQGLADETALKELLIMEQKWVPYPAYDNRAAWDSLLGPNKRLLIREGEKLLHYKWQLIPATAYLEYERSGNRTVMEAPYGANSRALNTLMLAELAEGEGRFIDQLLNGVYMSCEMNSWVLSAHLPNQSTKRSLPDFREQFIDLASGGYGALLCWIHYFFRSSFDKIDPVVTIQLREAVEERILAPYMNNDGMWWMAFRWKPGQIINNWNPWCNSDVLQCFLLMENDKERLSKAVYRTMRSVDRFLNFVKADGACEEGPSYWQHAAGKLCDYLQILFDATGGRLTLFNEPMVRRMGEYISRSYVGGGWVVNFADASARENINPALVYRFGQRVGSDEMRGFAASLLNGKAPEVTKGNDAFRSLQSLLCLRELSETAPVYDTPDVVWYPETEFCYMRNGEGMFVAAKGGFNNESHNHNDVGTFSLYVNAVPLLIDAGVGTYTKKTFSGERYSIWTMRSAYHNLPVINGIEQRFGQRYRAMNTVCDEKRRLFSTDIAAAYPEEAKVDSWVRTYRLKGDRLIITDDYALSEAYAASRINFLVRGNVTFPEEGKIRIEADGQAVEMSYPLGMVTEMERIELNDSRLSKVWGKEIFRISLKAEKNSPKGTYEFVVKKAG